MILGLAFSAALLAQAPQQPAPHDADETTQGRHVDKQQRPKGDVPDPDLIGFLGDYEDAADGLDPIGLSEQQAADAAQSATAQKKKDGNGP
jgi:hypothetical protein